jgi:hypothetical protein
MSYNPKIVAVIIFLTFLLYEFKKNYSSATNGGGGEVLLSSLGYFAYQVFIVIIFFHYFSFLPKPILILFSTIFLFSLLF